LRRWVGQCILVGHRFFSVSMVAPPARAVVKDKQNPGRLHGAGVFDSG
jgi:hypothetical protein